MGIAMFNASQRQSNSNNDAHEKTQIGLPICFKRSDYHQLCDDLPNLFAQRVNTRRLLDTKPLF